MWVRRYSRWAWGGISACFLASLAAAAVSSDALPAGNGDASEQAPAQRAFIIPIHREITDITLDSIDRRLAQVREEGGDLVIFDLDTPGGALGATLTICHSIKKLRDEGIRTYAWVNHQAYSAGTIIALATDGIVMTTNATMGDSQPIMITPGGAAAVPRDIEAKAISPLLAELRDSARRNNLDPTMVMALIRPELRVFWLVNTDTGERRFADVLIRDELFGLVTPPDEFRARSDDDDERPRRQATRHEPVPDTESLTAWRYVREDPILGAVRQPIITDRELLTMRTPEALAYDFAEATINSERELREYFNIEGEIQRMEHTLVEHVVAWLASPMVRGVLFLLMLLGAYTEFQSPGFGLPGAVALIALVLFLGAPYVAGFAVTWEIVLVLLGLVLIAVELFVLPGFGVAGLLGLLLLFIGTLATFMPPEPGFDRWPSWPAFPQSYEYLQRGLWSLAGGTLGAVTGMFLVAKYLPKVPVASRIIAPNPTREELVLEDPYGGAAQVGDIGISESPLRPAGKARFGATLVDVVTEGEYIDKVMRVEVIGRHGSRVVVRRVD